MRYQFYETLDTIMETMGDFPISRQNLLGFQGEDSQIAVLIADWTSAEEKDKFEPGKSNRTRTTRVGSPPCLLWQDSNISLSNPHSGRWLTRQTHHLLGNYEVFCGSSSQHDTDNTSAISATT